MPLSPASVRLLARCNGFEVEAGGAVVGSVETPVFSGTSLRPDYLILRTADEIPGRFRLVPPDLVVAVDPRARTVCLGLEPDEVANLDEPDA